VALEVGGVEVRAKEAGGMGLTFYRFPSGADLQAALRGLPGDACQCPHWGYVTSGRLRIHTASGAHDVAAGQAFYVEPGHWPEAMEDTEMAEISPVAELREVADHILHQVARE
jgi:hypothetical protein